MTNDVHALAPTATTTTTTTTTATIATTVTASKSKSNNNHHHQGMPPQEDHSKHQGNHKHPPLQHESTLMIGMGGEDASAKPSSSSAGGFHLRWSRLLKTVEIKPEVHGLVAHARQAHSSRNASFRASTVSNENGTTKDLSNNDPTTHNKKTILHAVSGEAVPGEILACMGPSGSGKTSLMNVLSGRASYQEGVLSVNGHVMNKASALKRIMSKVAYVKQADIFFGHLSVRDQFTYTALLRLPKEVDRHGEVERILRLLRLNKVADSPIMMLSGGEKKRVNIGTELLTDPQLILLDEPTSGLDSTSAVSLLRLLRSLAREHSKTIVTSIHQPSSAMFHQFDKLLMLSDGKVVYFGTPLASLEYLKLQNMPCPEGYNASDHWMDLLVTDSAVDEERMEKVQGTEEYDVDDDEYDQVISLDDVEANGANGGLRQRRGNSNGEAKSATVPATLPRLLLQQAWDNDAVAERMDAALAGRGADDASSVHSADNHYSKSAALTTPKPSGGKYVTSWWTQYTVLTNRALKNSRSAIFTPLNLCKSVAIGLVAGLLWFRTGYTESSVSDIRGYYFFTMTFWVFDSMFNALMAFPAERVVVLKERASSSYRLSAYFLAKTTADAPVRLILPFLYMLVSFWMAGFDSSFAVFVGTIACTLLSVMAGEAMGLFVGAAVYDMETALTVMTVFTLALMLLGGFFVQNIPFWLVWAKYLSPFKYAFDSSLQLMFDRIMPCDGSGALGELCPTDGFVTPDQLRTALNIQGTIGFNVGMLLVFCFLPRYMAYVALRLKRGGERD